MVQYKCEICDYATERKSSLDVHFKSVKHSRMVSDYNKMLADGANMSCSNHKNELKCHLCKKEFAHSSSLSRHKKKCEKRITDGRYQHDDFNKFKTELTEITNRFKQELKEELREELREELESVKGKTVNFYMLNLYSEAPNLESLPDSCYALLGKEEKNSDLVETLIYHSKEGDLKEYLGDFLLGHYKKDDPREQSLWTTDVSRFVYIVREINWVKDNGGVKTHKKIIKPFLDYILSKIDVYYNKKCKKMNELQNSDDHQKRLNYKTHDLLDQIKSANNLRKIIANGKFAISIVKYLAKFFEVEKNKSLISYKDQEQRKDEKTENNKKVSIKDKRKVAYRRFLPDENGNKKVIYYDNLNNIK